MDEWRDVEILDSRFLIRDFPPFWASYLFPDFSIEEVMIVLGASLSGLEDFHVIRNWKDYVSITDMSLCQIDLEKQGSTIKASIVCSSC